MKKQMAMMAALTLLAGNAFGWCGGGWCGNRNGSSEEITLNNDITSQIPVIGDPALKGFNKVDNVAQYKMADWSNVVGIAKGITVEKAVEIANGNPDITFFFYTKGGQMVLEKEDGSYRVFRHGDTVFFSGTPWWGSAPGLADGYVKTAAE